MASGEMLNLILEDNEGRRETLGELFKKAPLTVLVFYRGPW